MSVHTNGSVYISHDVLADIAGFAAMESYGVVGMASRGLAAHAAQLLPGQWLRKGVHITPISATDDGHEVIEIDLYVVIEYGTNLAEVSRNLSDAVVYSLEHLAQVEVARCDVHVVDVKVR
ncbi:MAG: Asp23/Gls24 family envelope stress response protein [Coriobacteriia bacterium]|nr:Asp23/Gls24 family envelope stress response protein [Coriobacteriia bacterium]